MANCLVTGGGGFIGSHITVRLVDMGHTVRVLDNFVTGRRSNLDSVANKTELIEGDLRVPEDCRRACDDVEFIFHEGAIPSVPKSVDAPQASHDSNINGTYNLLMAAKDCKCRRVIYAASSSAYGEAEESPKHEGMRPVPLSPYAAQKLAGEAYCRAFTECYGLETLSLRYFNVFGPRQDPESDYAAAVPAFVTAILNNTPPTVYGDGEQTRDFTYVDNVVHGNILALEVSRANGETINVACGNSISVNQAVARINALLGKSVKPVYTDPRPGDVRGSTADIRLAKQLIGFEPQVSFDEGLKQSIDYYRSLVD